MSEPLEKIPDDYICPGCGEASLSVSVDGTFFVRYGDFEAKEERFKEGGPPEDQSVRVYCDVCAETLPITSELAASLCREAEKA